MPPPSDTPPETSAQKSTFFRQGGWLMLANVLAGAFMWGVHFFSKVIPKAEYGSVGALLAMTLIIPTIPLQMVFAHQTAAKLASGRKRQLTRSIRQSWLALTLLWIVAAGVILFFQKDLTAAWKLSNPAALWMALIVWLACMWLPMFWGMLQGKQDFLGLGWSVILNGVGRFGGVAAAVLLFGGYAAGILTAVAVGYGLALALAIYATRGIWIGKGEPYDLKELVGQVIPLALGFGACQVLFTADTMFVKAWFPEEEVAYYVAAGTLSRALMWLVLPLAAVMFPKLVHSTVRAEKTDILMVTLVGTAVLAVCGGLGLIVVAPWVIPIVWPGDYVEAARALLPWYAGAIIPLSLGNVLVNALLGRGDYRCVAPLVLLIIGFVAALFQWHASFVQVLQVLTAANTLFFILCMLFTWAWPKKETRVTTAGPSLA